MKKQKTKIRTKDRRVFYTLVICRFLPFHRTVHPRRDMRHWRTALRCESIQGGVLVRVEELDEPNIWNLLPNDALRSTSQLPGPLYRPMRVLETVLAAKENPSLVANQRIRTCNTKINIHLQFFIAKPIFRSNPFIEVSKIFFLLSLITIRT